MEPPLDDFNLIWNKHVESLREIVGDDNTEIKLDSGITVNNLDHKWGIHFLHIDWQGLIFELEGDRQFIDWFAFESASSTPYGLFYYRLKIKHTNGKILKLCIGLKEKEVNALVKFLNDYYKEFAQWRPKGVGDEIHAENIYNCFIEFGAWNDHINSLRYTVGDDNSEIKFDSDDVLVNNLNPKRNIYLLRINSHELKFEAAQDPQSIYWLAFESASSIPYSCVENHLEQQLSYELIIKRYDGKTLKLCIGLKEKEADALVKFLNDYKEAVDPARESSYRLNWDGSIDEGSIPF